MKDNYFKTWTVGTRVLVMGRLTKRLGTVSDVIPHDSGNPWIHIKLDDGGEVSGTQVTLMNCGVTAK